MIQKFDGSDLLMLMILRISFISFFLDYFDKVYVICVFYHNKLKKIFYSHS